MQSLHEDLSRPDKTQAGTEKSFGLVFAGVFFIVALLPLFGGHTPHWWAAGVAVALLGISYLAPRLLRPFNRAWFAFGLLLHKVVSPIILAMLFFCSIMPIGLLMRLLQKDSLGLNIQKRKKSYWIERQPPGPDPTTMTKQF